MRSASVIVVISLFVLYPISLVASWQECWEKDCCKSGFNEDGITALCCEGLKHDLEEREEIERLMGDYKKLAAYNERNSILFGTANFFSKLPKDDMNEASKRMFSALKEKDVEAYDEAFSDAYDSLAEVVEEECEQE